MHDMRSQGICTISLNFLPTFHWRIQEGGGFFGTPGPPLSKGLDDRPLPLPLPLPTSRSGSGTALIHLEGNSILDIFCSLLI